MELAVLKETIAHAKVPASAMAYSRPFLVRVLVLQAITPTQKEIWPHQTRYSCWQVTIVMYILGRRRWG